jgi:hypothetical protein
MPVAGPQGPSVTDNLTILRAGGVSCNTHFRPSGLLQAARNAGPDNRRSAGMKAAGTGGRKALSRDVTGQLEGGGCRSFSEKGEGERRRIGGSFKEARCGAETQKKATILYPKTQILNRKAEKTAQVKLPGQQPRILRGCVGFLQRLPEGKRREKPVLPGRAGRLRKRASDPRGGRGSMMEAAAAAWEAARPQGRMGGLKAAWEASRPHGRPQGRMGGRKAAWRQGRPQGRKGGRRAAREAAGPQGSPRKPERTGTALPRPLTFGARFKAFVSRRQPRNQSTWPCGAATGK